MSDDPKSWWDLIALVSGLGCIVASYGFAWAGIILSQLSYERRAFYLALAAWLLVVAK